MQKETAEVDELEYFKKGLELCKTILPDFLNM